MSTLGAWRDRTNLFISYRQSYTHHPVHLRARHDAPYTDDTSERAGLMSTSPPGDAVIEMDVLPPRWLDVQDEITALLGEVAGKMKQLEQLHAKHVLPGFDDESVKAKEERDIEALTAEITRGFVTCQNRIRRIDAMVRQHPQTTTQAEETMAKNLKISLAARVGEASTTFRKKQSAYLKKLRALGGMATPVDNPTRAGTPATQNPYTDPAMMDSESDRSAAQSTLLQTAQVRRRTGTMDAAIEQREREIESIAQGVIDLSNIFQELNAMVIDQGTILDRVDYNVERTAEHVKAAEEELKVATGYQKKSTKRKIILLLILVVVGLFILLLIKPKRRAAAPGNAVAHAPGTAPGAIEKPGGGAGLPPARGRRAAEIVARPANRSEWKQRRRRRPRVVESLMVL